MDPSVVRFRPAVFALAGMCFFLPFITVSCGGMSETFSGMQVAFGGTIQGQRMGGNIPTLLALLAAVAGLVLSLRSRSAAPAATGAGIAGAVLLLVAQVQLRGESQGQGPVQLSFEVGYWLAVVALAGAAALGHVPMQQRASQGPPDTPGETGA